MPEAFEAYRPVSVPIDQYRPRPVKVHHYLIQYWNPEDRQKALETCKEAGIDAYPTVEPWVRVNTKDSEFIGQKLPLCGDWYIVFDNPNAES